MIIAMIVISAVVLGVCLAVAVVRLRRQRSPSDLRGNWWTEFERQFRAYAAEPSRRRRAGRADKPAERPPTD